MTTTGATAATATAGAGDTSTGVGATTTGQPAAPAWLPGADADIVAMANTKGWTGPDAVIRSYTHLEKLLGADRAGRTVEVPSEGADQKSLDGFYNKLGRPETVEKYSVKAKDFIGMDEATGAGLLKLAHETGLTDKQVQSLSKWNSDSSAKMTETLKLNATVERAAQETALKTEWGAAYDKNIQTGKEAAAKLGWTKEQIDAMQIGLGYDGVMKLAHKLGTQVGEGGFVEGQGGRQGSAEGILTPDQAKIALNKLTADATFMKSWTTKTDPGHAAAVQKKAQLTKWAYPS